MPTLNSIETRCERCCKPFFVTRAQLDRGRGKFCSKQCQWPLTTCTCECCGDVFRIKPSRIAKHGRFCSQSCDTAFHNDPTILRRRFFSSVQRHPNGCLLWVGDLTPQGYGLFIVKSSRGAHRFAYELANGPISNGLFVCHSCDNPACVNPTHLFLGTHKDNMVDMRNKDRSCRGERQGSHKFTDSKVRLIRKLHATGHHSYRELGRMFDVYDMTIRSIVLRKTWKHVE